LSVVSQQNWRLPKAHDPAIPQVHTLNLDAIVRLLALAAAVIPAFRRGIPAIEQTRTNPGAQLWLMCR
jgi:hypothetical protein